MVYMYHSFLIHSSADGHLGCFHVLAIIHSAAMNIGVHVPLSDLVSLVCMPRSRIAGSYGQSCLFAWTGRQVAAKLTSSKIIAQDVWSTLPLEEPSVEIACICYCCLVTKSCLTLLRPWTGPSVHGISQARILKCIAISFPGVFPTQGLNSSLLHWQVDSLPLSH